MYFVVGFLTFGVWNNGIRPKKRVFLLENNRKGRTQRDGKEGMTLQGNKRTGYKWKRIGIEHNLAILSALSRHK